MNFSLISGNSSLLTFTVKSKSISTERRGSSTAVKFIAVPPLRASLSLKTTSLFKNFNISKTDIYPFDFSKNRKYLLPETSEYITKYFSSKLKYENHYATDVNGDKVLPYYFNSDPSSEKFVKVDKIKDVKFMDFLILYVSYEEGAITKEIYCGKEPLTYKIYLVPIYQLAKYFYNGAFTNRTDEFDLLITRYSDNPIPSVRIDGVNYENLYSCNVFDLDRQYIYSMVKSLNSISPYITSVEFCKLPVVSVDVKNFTKNVCLFPFRCDRETVGDIDFIVPTSFPYNRNNSGNYFERAEYFYYETDFSRILENKKVLSNECFDEQTIYILGSKICTLKAKDYIYENTNAYCKIIFDFIPTPTSIFITYQIITKEGCALPNVSVKSAVQLNRSTTLVYDSAAAFNAENKYYDALTENAIDQYTTRKLFQGANEMFSGSTQMGAGITSGYLKNPIGAVVGLTQGINNIMRGIFTFNEMAQVSEQMREERDLKKKQAQAKPDEFVIGSGANVASFQTDKVMYSDENNDIRYDYSLDFVVEEKLITDNDFKVKDNLAYLYGLECYCFEENIIELFPSDNFYIKVIAQLNDGTTYASEYSEMIKLLDEGHRFFIVS